MNPNEPVLDRFDRLLRLGEHLLDALGRIESKLDQASTSRGSRDPELWTVAEVAAFLKCSKSKVYQHNAAGKLPCFHVGGQVRFEPQAIQAWARGQQVTRGVIPLPGRT